MVSPVVFTATRNQGLLLLFGNNIIKFQANEEKEYPSGFATKRAAALG
jgi:hypothetical protein